MKKKLSKQEVNNTKNVYEQRFDKLMMLIRIDKMLKTAVITHKK